MSPDHTLLTHTLGLRRLGFTHRGVVTHAHTTNFSENREGDTLWKAPWISCKVSARCVYKYLNPRCPSCTLKPNDNSEWLIAPIVPVSHSAVGAVPGSNAVLSWVGGIEYIIPTFPCKHYLNAVCHQPAIGEQRHIEQTVVMLRSSERRLRPVTLAEVHPFLSQFSEKKPNDGSHWNYSILSKLRHSNALST